MGAPGSDDGVVGSEADPAGKLLQQARDGAGRAGRRGLETDCGAVGGQEDFPHRLQTGLALGGEGTPGEESRGGDVQKTGREEGYGKSFIRSTVEGCAKKSLEETPYQRRDALLNLASQCSHHQSASKVSPPVSQFL